MLWYLIYQSKTNNRILKRKIKEHAYLAPWARPTRLASAQPSKPGCRLLHWPEQAAPWRTRSEPAPPRRREGLLDRPRLHHLATQLPVHSALLSPTSRALCLSVSSNLRSTRSLAGARPRAFAATEPLELRLHVQQIRHRRLLQAASSIWPEPHPR
jgi:hypothetical protein